MANFITILDTTLTSIANAIRSKNSKSIKYKPHEMAKAINDFGDGATTNIDSKDNKEIIGYLGWDNGKQTTYEKIAINIDNFVEKIKPYCFYRLYNVISIRAAYVREIGAYAFARNPAIEYYLPHAEIIREGAFYNSILPETFVLPRARTIERNAFNAIRGVKHLILPYAYNIDLQAFNTIRDLTDIYVGFSEEAYPYGALEYYRDNYGVNIHYDYYYDEDEYDNGNGVPW